MLQDAVAWLVQKDMVQVLLRAHLHQRQYVDQVQKVLKTLATEDGLQADPLELLWNLTEKVHIPPLYSNPVCRTGPANELICGDGASAGFLSVCLISYHCKATLPRQCGLDSFKLLYLRASIPLEAVGHFGALIQQCRLSAGRYALSTVSFGTCLDESG